MFTQQLQENSTPNKYNSRILLIDFQELICLL